MPAGITRTTRLTPLGRAYLERHPGVDWRSPDPGGEAARERVQRIPSKPRRRRYVLPVGLTDMGSDMGGGGASLRPASLRGEPMSAPAAQPPAAINPPIPPLLISNAAICPSCGSGNVLSLWRDAYLCRACGARFDVTPAESSA